MHDDSPHPIISTNFDYGLCNSTKLMFETHRVTELRLPMTMPSFVHVHQWFSMELSSLSQPVDQYVEREKRMQCYFNLLVMQWLLSNPTSQIWYTECVIVLHRWNTVKRKDWPWFDLDSSDYLTYLKIDLADDLWRALEWGEFGSSQRSLRYQPAPRSYYCCNCIHYPLSQLIKVSFRPWSCVLMLERQIE